MGDIVVFGRTASSPPNAGQSRRIAIVGIGVRIRRQPAGSDRCGRIFEAGRDFVGPLPDLRRREAQRVGAALGMSAADLNNAELAYLEEIDKFDYAHFRMAPQKAALLDPREKIFLETARCTELLKMPATTASASRARARACFSVKHGSADFSRVLEAAGVSDGNQMLESLTPSMAASRISFLLDLKGPALLIDTACSSALSALSLAVDALRFGRGEMALAGAIKLHMLPFRRAGRTEIESPDWRTHAFDAQASGTGGGEASIALLLKPLDRALADGDPIHAILRGPRSTRTANSSGITAPNAQAQAEVIDQAWKDAAIHPQSLASSRLMEQERGSATRSKFRD